MTGAITVATARRVVAQLLHDHRTLALLLVVPCVLMTLLWWIYDGGRVWQAIGAPLLGIFPFVVMFLVTSVTTLRERKAGTLERLLTMPLGRADFVIGYALAFGGLALVQAVVVSALALGPLDLQVTGTAWLLTIVAVLVALLGMALGLSVSAFAANEFQAVQFMPAVVLPQLLLCGLLVPRELMPGFLEALSTVLPLSYAVDATKAVSQGATSLADIGTEVAVMAGFIVVAVTLGALTLRRQTD
jgi:ABC-2 type transport system permease protein